MAWTQHICNNYLQEPYRCASVGQKLYSFRCSGDERSCCGNVEVFVFDTVTYSHYTQPLVIRGNERQQQHISISFVVAVSQKIYVFGPVTKKRENIVEMYCFDTKTSEWTCIETMGGVAVHYFQCICAYENKIFACVKTNKWNGNEEQQSIFALDLSTNMWKCVSKNPWNKKFNAVFAYIQGSLVHVLLTKYCKSRGRIALFDTISENFQWLDHTQGVPLPPLAKWLVFVHEDFLYVFADQFFHFNVKPQWKIYRYCMKDNWWDEIMIEKTPINACFNDLVALNSKVYFFSSEPRGIYVLDFAPSLTTLCFKAVCHSNLDTSVLPRTLQQDLKYFMW
ncbi:hypothetical protein R5R35_014612 [Gryllus longicercus]|uniref:Uncharacterized protein n=1 Tax=Gryllus longicercus TaxID=2509291 RepID=A0AAN9Z871_9ORTH